MTTWIVGDPHGCAEELSVLLDRLALGPDDRVVVVGDLLHRGPDPVGVMELMREVDAEFVLGNHERRILARFGLAPDHSDARDRPPTRLELPTLEARDLDGDGGAPCHVPAAWRAEVIRFLQGHRGYFLEDTDLEGAGTTRDGRPWCVVHAGLVCGRSPRDTDPEQLVSLRRLPGRGRPYWYEVYQGECLILFGHTPSKLPRQRRVRGLLVALGLDTGCVYGGCLTAYAPELHELVQVEATSAYVCQ